MRLKLCTFKFCLLFKCTSLRLGDVKRWPTSTYISLASRARTCTPATASLCDIFSTFYCLRDSSKHRCHWLQRLRCNMHKIRSLHLYSSRRVPHKLSSYVLRMLLHQSRACPKPRAIYSQNPRLAKHPPSCTSWARRHCIGCACCAGP